MKKSVILWDCRIKGERPKLLGTITVDKNYTREDVYILCNWKNYNKSCPDEMKEIGISSIGKGLLMFIDNKYHLSLSTGWLETDSMNNDLEFAIHSIQNPKFTI